MQAMKPKLLLATNNPGKVEELLALLAGLDLEILTPDALGIAITVIEDGQTYAQNAAKKACAFAEASGLVALGDDSGLEVDALNGKPGLFSNRFAPQGNASDADRRSYLLDQLCGKPRPWTACFKATLAVAFSATEYRLATGCCVGEIIPEERGTNGFGYDPIFLIPPLNRTMAELTMDEKNRLSHRAKAVANAVAILTELLH